MPCAHRSSPAAAPSRPRHLDHPAPPDRFAPLRRRVGAVLAGLWAGAALLAAGPLTAAPNPAPVGGCRKLEHEGAPYTVCRFNLRAYDLRLLLDDAAGQPFGSLPNLLRSPAGRGLAMAMNAGMYHHDLQPVGLFVTEGRQRTPLNTRPGPGNFHLKPNGVFYLADGKVGILETGVYAKRKPRAALATQSGPMLVIGGKLHPRFSSEGESRKYRNGVGVADGSEVTFAISDEPVSFGAFARLFRDGLGCRDALFLDGSVSALHAPDLGRTDFSLRPIGPIIAAVRR